MDRNETRIYCLTECCRHLIAAVSALADIVPQPHTAKAVVYDLIHDAESNCLAARPGLLEPGDAPGPSAAIAASAEAANKGDPEGPLEAPETILQSPA